MTAPRQYPYNHGRYQNGPNHYVAELDFYQSLAEHGTLLQQFLLPDKKGQVGNQYPANDQATRSRLSQAH